MAETAIPIAQVAARPALTCAAPSAPGPVTLAGRLLVVDDDFMVRKLSRAVLEQAGCTVYDCADGGQALSLCADRKPDLVLLDVVMPGMTGFEVCAALRSQPDGDDIPIIMMTALEDTEALHTAYRLGATDFITKPISWQALPYRMQYLLKAGQAFRDLRQSETKLRQAHRIARMGSWSWDPHQDELVLSDLCRDILGLVPGQKVATLPELIELFHPCERERVWGALLALGQRGEALDLDCRGCDLEGCPRYYHLGGEPHLDQEGAVSSVTGTLQDITERRLNEERIRTLAYYDSLTGLANRTLFKEHLRRSLAMAQQHRQVVAVLFLDLNRFKAVNDTLGHEAGDQLLRLVAERVQRHLRGYDTLSRDPALPEGPMVSRLGGDEFTVLLEGLLSPESAAIVARRIIGTLEAPFLLQGEQVFISASIGISTYPDDGADPEALVKCADIAMYAAKQHGEGCYQYYREEMNESSLRRHLVEKHLRRAVEEETLSVWFQPQVAADGYRVVGLEALARWHSEVLGPVEPDEFVSVAEETGLIIQLDRFVLQSVCAQIGAWLAEGLCPGLISVNLSSRHFQRKHLGETVALVRGLPEPVRHRLCLEITERTLLDQEEVVMQALDEIAASGVRIALDDFGTGYSSLSYLTRVPCHILKIDRSFVMSIGSDPGSRSIIVAITALAASLGKKVIAEGVETLAQQEFLREHGCRDSQGFLFSAARTVPALREVLERGELPPRDEG